MGSLRRSDPEVKRGYLFFAAFFFEPLAFFAI